MLPRLRLAEAPTCHGGLGTSPLVVLWGAGTVPNPSRSGETPSEATADTSSAPHRSIQDPSPVSPSLQAQSPTQRSLEKAPVLLTSGRGWVCLSSACCWLWSR